MTIARNTFRTTAPGPSLAIAAFAALLCLSPAACQRRPEDPASSKSEQQALVPEPGEENFAIQWVADAIPARLKQGSREKVKVSFRNAGPVTMGIRMLAVSYHWADEARPTQFLAWDSDYATFHTAVGRPVEPGANYEAEITVKAPETPGNYVITVDLVREGVAWFSTRGATPLVKKVVVE